MTASSGVHNSDSSSACTAAKTKSQPFVTAVKSQAGSGRQEDWLSKGNYGKVPSYLVERQLQLAEQMIEEQVGSAIIYTTFITCRHGTMWTSFMPDTCLIQAAH